MAKKGKVISMAQGNIKIALKTAKNGQKYLKQVIEQKEKLECLQEIKLAAESSGAPKEVFDILKKRELEVRKEYKDLEIIYSNTEETIRS